MRKAKARLGKTIHSGRQRWQRLVDPSRGRRKDAQEAMKFFSFEVILCMILLHSMKKFSIIHHLFPYNLRNTSKSLYRILTLMAQPIRSHSWMKEALLMVDQNPILGPHPNESDSYRVTLEWHKRSWWSLNSLYRVRTLIAQTYTESLLNDESAPDGHSYSLYRVLTLMAQTYMKSILNEESALDDHSDSLYQVLTLTARLIQRPSWKMKVLLMVTLTSYIKSSPWCLDLH